MPTTGHRALLLCLLAALPCCLSAAQHCAWSSTAPAGAPHPANHGGSPAGGGGGSNASCPEDDEALYEGMAPGGDPNAVAAAALPDSPLCEMAVVDGVLSVEEFRRGYKRQRPVVFRTRTNSSAPGGVNAAFVEATSEESLKGTWGHLTAILSSANSYSHDKARTSLREYIEGSLRPRWGLDQPAAQQFTLFGDHGDEWDALLSMYEMPLDGARDDGILSFGAAGAFSGVSFHTHGAAISETLHGRKRWFLAPPGDDAKPPFEGDESQLQWVYRRLPLIPAAQRPLQCTVPAGWAIYIPSEWHHATLNLDDYNAFVSTFTHEPPTALDDL